MSRHEGMVRGFSQLSRSYYGEACLKNRKAFGCDLPVEDEITVGMYDPKDGGTTGEFAFVWATLAGRRTCRLETFCDSWSALAQFSDLIHQLEKWDSTEQRGHDLTPDTMRGILRTLGVRDMTKTERP